MKLKRFAQEKPHTLVVVVTGADALRDKAWAQAVARNLDGETGMDVAIVVYSAPDKTADDVGQAISDVDHERLVFIAKDEGVAACATYLSRFSAGVVEEFVACFTKPVDMPIDIMTAVQKMPSVHVMDATGANPMAEVVDGQVIEVAEPVDAEQLAASAASFAAPETDEGEPVEEPGPEKREALPEDVEEGDDEEFLEDDVF